MQRIIARTLVIAALVALVLPASAQAGDVAAGKASYDQTCASCHGPNGKGDGPLAASLPDPKPRDLAGGEFKFDTDKDGTAGSDADLKNVIMKGAAEYGGSVMMAPQMALSEADVDNLIAYIRSLK